MLPYDIIIYQLFSRKCPIDVGVATYADLISYKHAVICLHMGGRSFILELLLCTAVSETDSGGYSFVWTAQF